MNKHRKLWSTIILLFNTMLYSGGVYAQAPSPHSNTITGTVTLFDGNGKIVEDRSGVVIFLEGEHLLKSLMPEKKTPKISHKGRQFSPPILPIRKGTIVDFFNDEKIYHNVFSLSKAKLFDLGIYPQGSSKLVTFNQPGLVKIYCNIHPNMVSNIMILNNDFFSQTDSDGTFTINNIPDGNITLRTWHEFSESLSRPLSIQGGGIHQQILKIRITKKRRTHKNKFGKYYKNKY